MKGFILKHNCKVEHTTQNGRENWVGSGGLEEMCIGHVMFGAKTEANLLEYSKYDWNIETKYWYNYHTLVDSLVTCTYCLQ